MLRKTVISIRQLRHLSNNSSEKSTGRNQPPVSYLAAPQKLKDYMDTDEHRQTMVINDIQVRLNSRCYTNAKEVKVNSGVESCVLSLRVYCQMFLQSLTHQSLSKPTALASASHIILESYTDGILPVYSTLILYFAGYK